MGSFLASNQYDGNANVRDKQNGERIYNATMEEEVNNIPPQDTGPGLLYQCIKLVLVPIAIIIIIILYEPIRINITGLEAGIEDISTFVNIDHTPMSKLVVSMDATATAVKSIQRTLWDTNIPALYVEQIEDFFHKVTKEIKATQATAQDGRTFYLQHRVQLDNIRSFLSRMKDSIQLSNIPHFLDQIDEVVNIIENQVRELRYIQKECVSHQENMQEFKDRSDDLQNDILEQKDATRETENNWLKAKVGTGVAAALGTAALLNPVAGVAVALAGAYMAVEDIQRIEKELEGFGQTAIVFSVTTDVLADAVDAIGIVIDNLEEVSISLKATRQAIDLMMYELGESERKKIISEYDQRRLINVIDFVIDKTKNSKKKYEEK